MQVALGALFHDQDALGNEQVLQNVPLRLRQLHHLVAQARGESLGAMR